MPKSKSKARSHEESRAAVCIVCFKKATRNCSQLLKNVLLDPKVCSLFSSLDINDTRVPSGICETCRIYKIWLKKTCDLQPFDTVDT